MGTDTDERLRALAQRAVQSVEDWLGIKLTADQREAAGRTLGVQFEGPEQEKARVVEVATREELQEAYDRAASEVACLTDPQVTPGDPGHLLLCSRDEVPPRLQRARGIAALIVTSQRYADSDDIEDIGNAAEAVEQLLSEALAWLNAAEAAHQVLRGPMRPVTTEPADEEDD